MKNLVFVALDAKEYEEDIKKKYPDFNIKYISLEWRYKSIEDWVLKVIKNIKNNDIDLLVGFSIGGVVSLLVSKDIKPKRLEIISPSPFFREFLKSYNKTMLNVAGKKRINDINNLSIKNLKKYCKTNIYVGSEELEIMKRVSRDIGRQVNCSVSILKNKNHCNIFK